jgi:arylformamidase
MGAGGEKIIDLSMLIEEGMQTFGSPWHPVVEITQLGRHGIENRETRKLVLGTHTGSHIDAPRHFIPNGDTVESIPLEILVGTATVVDFSKLANKTEISKAMLIKEVGSETCPKRLICRFDWDLKALRTNKYYSDHAFFSEEACEWMVSTGCKLLALDTPQPDNPLNGRGAAKDAPNHKILLGNKVVIVEYLVNLQSLKSKEVYLVVAPLKILSGDGAPARCFVIEGR